MAKDLSSPKCVIYKSSHGVVFVAEKSCLSYLDVGNVVTLNPKAMKKTRLHKEILNRHLLQPGERATVAQMRQLLSEWIEENSPDTSRENGLKILIDEISPLALAADDDRDMIYVSQRDSIEILKVNLLFRCGYMVGNGVLKTLNGRQSYIPILKFTENVGLPAI